MDRCSDVVRRLRGHDGHAHDGFTELSQAFFVGIAKARKVATVEVSLVLASACRDPLKKMILLEVEVHDASGTRKRPRRARVNGVEELVVGPVEIEVGKDEVLDRRVVEHGGFCQVTVLVVMDKDEGEFRLELVPLDVRVESVEEGDVL